MGATTQSAVAILLSCGASASYERLASIEPNCSLLVSALQALLAHARGRLPARHLYV